MKQSLVFLAAGLLAASPAFAQTSFERHYGASSKMDVFAAAVPTPDGGYLFAGTTANYGAQALDVLLLKTDAAGNTLWAKTWGGPGNDGAADIVAANGDEGYLVAGHVAGPGGDRNFLALHIDENGDEIWHLDLGNAQDDAATAAAALPNGEFIVAGNTIPSLTAGQLLLMVRTGPTGNIVWQKTEDGISDYNVVKGVATTAEGGFLIATPDLEVIKYSGAGIFQWSTFLLTPAGAPRALEHFRRDADGTLLAGGIYNAFGTPFLAFVSDDGTAQSVLELENPADPQQFKGSYVESACRMSDGNYALWLVDWYGVNSSPNEDSFVGLDPGTGQIVWEIPVSAADLTDFRHPGQVLAAPGGGFFLLGGLTSEETGLNAAVISYSSAGTETARETYGVEAPDDNEVGRQVRQTPDGGYIVLSRQINGGNSSEFWLVKTDAAGSVQWSGTYGLPDADDPFALDLAADGGYIAAGRNGPHLRVLKVNSGGGMQWLKQFDVGGTGFVDFPFGLRTLPDGSFLAAFTTYGAASVGKLMKISAQGDSLWLKAYPFIGTNIGFYGLTLAPNDGYAVCGYAVIEATGALVPLVMLTESDGDLLWSETYDPGPDGVTVLIDIHPTAGGGFVTQGLRLNGIQPYVLGIDADGDSLWSASPLPPQASYLFSWASAHRGATGETYLFEEKRRYPPIGTPFLSTRDVVGSVQKLDANGDLLCESDFGEGHAGQFRGGTLTADGGAAAVGAATFDGSMDAWLVKLNADCTVGFQTPLAPPFDLTVAPNPSPGLFSLQIETAQNGPVAVEIVNAAGEKVLAWQGDKIAPVFRQNFDLGAAPAGAYFVWVKIGASARSVTWVKQ